MNPGHWRNPERDRDLHSTLRLVNGLLAMANIVMVGFILYTAGTWVARLFT